MTTQIHGQIVFEPDAPPFTGARLRVQLVDVSTADAPAIVLAEAVQEQVSYSGHAGESIEFFLEGQVPAGTTRCTLEALIDLNRDRQISEGDFINVESIPIDVESPGQVIIRVKQVE